MILILQAGAQQTGGLLIFFPFEPFNRIPHVWFECNLKLYFLAQAGGLALGAGKKIS